MVQDNLAIKLLEGDFEEGDHIVVDVDDHGQVVFSKKSE